MNKTPIEWTDYSANPLKFRDAGGKSVWGCVHASPGCVHCYAETLAKRYGRGGPFNAQTMAGLTPFLDEKELHQMLTYKPASGARCFIGDMTDVFGEWVPDELLDRLFTTFSERPDVTWQVLTKRAERMQAFLSDGQRQPAKWPLENVWIGVSCEDQQRADQRIPLLRNTTAAVRFVSAEPLLGPIDLLQACYADLPLDARMNTCANDLRVLDWVIVGGESGPGARKCSIEWVRHLISQCDKARVSCFVKQLGSDSRSALGFGPIDGVRGKGNHIDEWPNDIRVREWPMGERTQAR